MPESKSRHPHKHPQQHHNTPGIHTKSKKANRLIIVTVLFFGVLGLGIGFFVDSESITVLLSCLAAGVLAGYIVGYQIKKSLSEK